MPASPDPLTIWLHAHTRCKATARDAREGRSGPAQHPGLGLIYSVPAQMGIYSHPFFSKAKHPGRFSENGCIFFEWLRIYNQMVTALGQEEVSSVCLCLIIFLS